MYPLILFPLVTPKFLNKRQSTFYIKHVKHQYKRRKHVYSYSITQ